MHLHADALSSIASLFRLKSWSPAFHPRAPKGSGDQSGEFVQNDTPPDERIAKRSQSAQLRDYTTTIRRMEPMPESFRQYMQQYGRSQSPPRTLDQMLDEFFVGLTGGHVPGWFGPLRPADGVPDLSGLETWLQQTRRLADRARERNPRLSVALMRIQLRAALLGRSQ